MLKRIFKGLLVVGVLLLASTSAQAQTPAAIATSTQVPFTPAPTPVGKINKDIGSSAAFISHIASGVCLVNPPSIPGGRSVLLDCPVPLAKTGDSTFLNVRPPNTSTSTPFVIDECFFLQGGVISTDGTLRFRLVNRDTSSDIACDPPTLTIDYLILRINTSY